MKKRNGVLILIFLTLPFDLSAVQTNSFVHRSYKDFNSGEFENVALSNTGILTLGSELEEIVELDESIVWNVVSDPAGNLYLATGNRGKVLRIDRERKVSTVFAPEEVLSRALALDSEGRLYVGTSPKGRVYRLTAEGRPEVYFDPPESYIWDMTFDDEDNLFIATGGKAVIYRLPRGYHPEEDEAVVWFRCDQAHLTTLAWDAGGGLLAGSSQEGILYRISDRGKGFALYNTGDQEVKQIVPTADGGIYFMTFSSKSIGPDKGTRPAGRQSEEEETYVVVANRIENGPMRRAPQMKSTTGSGMIYYVDPEGFVEAYWGLPQAHIFSVAHGAGGELVVGTSDRGHIFSIAARGEWRLAQQVPEGGEVSVILPESEEGDDLLLFTSNPARIYRLQSRPAKSGSFTAGVYDAKQISRWGRLLPLSHSAHETQASFYTRSGNTSEPDDTWSEWEKVSPVEDGIRIVSPISRFLQYRLNLTTVENGATPSGIEQVRVFYQSKNAAPYIGVIRLVPVGLQLFRTMGNPTNIDLGKFVSEDDSAKLLEPPPVRIQLRRLGEEGMMSVAWQAFDPNEDQLEFTVSIKGIDQSDWITLWEKLGDPVATFNTNGFEEGYYQLRVVASDEPDNDGAQALSGYRLSEVFLIDNTPPKIEITSQSASDEGLELEFHSVDAHSIHRAAFYTLDGQPSRSIRPIDGLFDSRKERFQLAIDSVGKGAHSLVLEVYDEKGRSAVLTVPFELE